MKKILIVIAAFLFASIGTAMPLLAGGKIVGKVVDSETKEALPGASVVVVGTTKGAVTNADGDFFILNVDPGNYTLKASFVGYNETSQSNIRVSANLTTEVSFELKSISLTTGTIEIIATRPLIDRNITNQNSIIDQEALRNLPIRDVQSVVATQSGVVRQSGNLYVRGSRADATGMYVDGVKVNDPVFGGSNSSEISSAIEEIQFQSGGYTAEYGGANAGIISTTSRVGGEQYKVSVDLLTDNFVGKNSDRKFLGGYSYGYSNYEVSFSGPILPSEQRFKFLIAGRNEFTRSPSRYWTGLKMENVNDPTVGPTAININYPDGYRLNNARNKFVVQGNLTADLKPLTFKLGGKYQYDKWRDGAGLANVFNSARVPINERSIATANLKTTHFLASNLFYEINLSYYGDFFVNMDPEIKHDILGYGDSVTNAKYGYLLEGDGQDVQGFGLYGQTFSFPGNQLAGYTKTKNKNYTAKVDLFWQLNKQNEVKTGFEYTYHNIRRYQFGSAFSLRDFISKNADSENQWYQRLDNYGYDIYGNSYDGDGAYAAKHPQFFGAYIQDKMEFSDLVINAGLRLDGIVSDSKEFADPGRVPFDANGIIRTEDMKEVPSLWKISPRLGFSFSLTDKAKFHAQYGKFVQQSRLRDIYQGIILVSDNIKGGYAISAPVGFGLRPERTTQYDLGFSQQLTENVAIDVTGFYKDIKDQVQIRQQPNADDAEHGAYYYFANGDFSTTKGFELKIDIRRTERVLASVNYTFSDAQGTGSASASGFRAIWQSPRPTAYFPQNVSPLDFNQAHRGSVSIDYRFIGDDGPVWVQNSGLNLLFQFNSGHNFTKVSGFANTRVPQESYNTSTTPWNFQLDLRVDKSFEVMGFKTNIYLLVMNVLDTKNIVNVHMQTGSTNDGYLETDEGKSIVSSYASRGAEYVNNYVKLYNAFNNTNSVTTVDGTGVDPYGNPREIRLGFKIDY